VNFVQAQHDSGQVVGARKTDGGWSMTGARGDVTLLRRKDKDTARRITSAQGVRNKTQQVSFTTEDVSILSSSSLHPTT
jgi:hypothetical protein